MSKERELLQECYFKYENLDAPIDDLMNRVAKLLAQPEQPPITPRQGFAETKILSVALYWMEELKHVYSGADYDCECPYLIEDFNELEGLREVLREGLRENPVAWMWTRKYGDGGYTNRAFQMKCEADEYAKDSENLKYPDLVRPLYLGVENDNSNRIYSIFTNSSDRNYSRGA